MQNVVAGSGRYDVQVDDEQASIALKSENLQSAPELGSTVILVSLATSAGYLNGSRGIVQGFNRETRLFEVMVSPTWMNALDCEETIF